jgi:hypothetical protein
MIPELRLMSECNRTHIKERFLRGFEGADLQKKSEHVMIALEHAPHWKSGIVKKIMFDNTKEYNSNYCELLWKKNGDIYV